MFTSLMSSARKIRVLKLSAITFAMLLAAPFASSRSLVKVCDPMYKGIYGANYNRISVVFADGEIGVVDYDNNVIFKTPGRGLLTYTGVDGYMTYTDMDRRVRIVDYNGKEVGRFPEKVSANKVGEGDFFIVLCMAERLILCQNLV